MGALLALVVSYRRQRDAEAGKFGAELAQAATQLGNDSAAVRMAGVYALAALADNHPDRRQQCVDVLCAYIRLPYIPRPVHDRTSRQIREIEPGSDRPVRTITEVSYPVGEREVRLTIFRLIRDHLRCDAKASWQGLDFTFTGAVLDGGDLTGAIFSGGRVDFREAIFPSGTFSFKDAVFCGVEVLFDRASFSNSSIGFVGARFMDGRVSFWAAKVARSASPTRESAGGIDGLNFIDAQFSGGEVAFNNVEFAGRSVTFRRARFSRGIVTFDRCNFLKGDIEFFGADFTGGQVSFSGSLFTGSYVDFSQTTFSGGVCSFVDARFLGSNVRFERAQVSGVLDFSRAEFGAGILEFYRTNFSNGVAIFRSALYSTDCRVVGPWGEVPVEEWPPPHSLTSGGREQAR